MIFASLCNMQTFIRICASWSSTLRSCDARRQADGAGIDGDVWCFSRTLHGRRDTHSHILYTTNINIRHWCSHKTRGSRVPVAQDAFFGHKTYHGPSYVAFVAPCDCANLLTEMRICGGCREHTTEQLRVTMCSSWQCIIIILRAQCQNSAESLLRV